VHAVHSPTTAAVRLLAYSVWTLLVAVPVALLVACGQVSLCRRVGHFYWRVAVLIVGLDIVVRGRVCAERPALFVCNHASYLDIVVLGSLLPAAFVAKKDVRDWPVIGLLARLGRTVFVDRRPRKSLHQRDEMVARLSRDRESVILFPEGTSNDGNHVLPFKSALFSVAETVRPDGRPLAVQPVSVAYTRLDGLPIGRGWRPFVAWYGGMELVSHVWTVLGLGRLTVEVDCHPPVTLEQFGSRKALADHCHDVVSHAVVMANAGRATPSPAGTAAPIEAEAVG
jgi:1-acyl-sn-glycerol-3-phosphate acyltransferase